MRRHLATTVVLSISLTAQTISATTYVSVEPIPSRDVVGQQALETILSAGYSNLELWSNRLLNECMIVDSVAGVLAADGAISTINGGNTSVLVAAGGFEGITNPSYVFTVRDSGLDAASATDIEVFDNALGYILRSSHFQTDWRAWTPRRFSIFWAPSTRTCGAVCSRGSPRSPFRVHP